MLDIVACYHHIQFQGKTYDPHSRKWQKNPSFWTWFRPVGPKFELPNFFTKLVLRNCSKLSFYAIKKKTREPNLTKLNFGPKFMVSPRCWKHGGSSKSLWVKHNRFMSETQLSMTVSDFGFFWISSWKWALLSKGGGMLDIVTIYHCIQFQGKRIQTQ